MMSVCYVCSAVNSGGGSVFCKFIVNNSLEFEKSTPLVRKWRARWFLDGGNEEYRDDLARKHHSSCQCGVNPALGSPSSDGGMRKCCRNSASRNWNWIWIWIFLHRLLDCLCYYYLCYIIMTGKCLLVYFSCMCKYFTFTHILNILNTLCSDYRVCTRLY